MNAALQGETLEQHLLAIGALDNDCRALAMNHADDINRALVEAQQAPLFDGYWQQLRGHHPRCRTAALTRRLAAASGEFSDEQARLTAELYRLQLQKLARLERLRRYTCHKAWLDIWLLLHVPLSLALLAALSAHIVSVFYFW